MTLGDVDPDGYARHALVGAAIGGTTAVAIDYWRPGTPRLQRFVIAAIPVVVAAVGKEIYDSRHRDCHTCDPLDALTTIAGGALAIDLAWRF